MEMHWRAWLIKIYCMNVICQAYGFILRNLIQCHLDNFVLNSMCLSHLALDESKRVTSDPLLVTKIYYFELLPICREIRLMALV